MTSTTHSILYDKDTEIKVLIPDECTYISGWPYAVVIIEIYYNEKRVRTVTRNIDKYSVQNFKSTLLSTLPMICGAHIRWHVFYITVVKELSVISFNLNPVNVML